MVAGNLHYGGYMKKENMFLWCEKYRPSTIDECILPEAQKNTFKDFVKRGEIPNMLLCGTAGVGKTTVARALCEEMGCDYIIINSSLESGIDTLRTKIQQFCSSVSFSGGTKVVILDEFDHANPNSFQPAFRAFLEEFSNNARFILTCNYKNRIIEPIHSRCTVFEFSIDKADRPSIAGKFMKRIKTILETESIEYDEKVVAALLMKHFPDYRRVINELQRYSSSGVIDAGILSSVQEINIKNLMKTLKDKDFKGMRKWVVENTNNESNVVFRKIYDSCSEYVKPQSIPNLVLLLADYQYKSSFSADQEINLVACLTEIMATLEFV